MEAHAKLPEKPKQCPQCKTVYPEPSRMFVEPVASCLPCYLRLPVNRDLWRLVDNMDQDKEAATFAWRELCRRAANSRFAKKQRRQERLRGHASKLSMATEPQGVSFAADVLSSGAIDVVAPSTMSQCQGCSNMFANEDLQELPRCPHDEHDSIPLVFPPQLCGGCRENAGSGLLKMKCYMCHGQFTPEELYFSVTGKLYCSPDWQKFGRKLAIG